MRAERRGSLWLLPETEDDLETVELLKERCTVPHPTYVRNTELGLSTKGVPKTALFWQEKDGWFGFPREMDIDYEFDIEDKTTWPERDLEDWPCKWDPNHPDAAPGQEDAVEDTWRALQASDGTILDAQAGGGKTVMGVELIRRMGTPTVILCHKDFLMRQWEKTVHEFLPGARVGRIKRDQADSGYDFDVVMASVHSVIGTRDYGPDVFESFGFMIADECFPAGTLVETHDGPKPIEDVQVGEDVLNALGMGEVVEVMRRPKPRAMVRLEFSDESSVTCTALHPFLVDGGWLSARDLDVDDQVLTFDGCADMALDNGKHTLILQLLREAELDTGRQKVLFPSLLRPEHRGEDTGVFNVPVVPIRARDQAEEQVLRRRVPEAGVGSTAEDTGGQSCGCREGEGTTRSEPLTTRGGVRTDEAGQPDARRGSAEESVAGAPTAGTQAPGTRWQWSRAHGASAATLRGPGGAPSGMGDRARAADEGDADRAGAPSIPLQDRHRTPGLAARGGGGRELTHGSRGTGARLEEERVPTRLRVVSCTLVEHGGAREPRESRPEDFVYNLRVGGHPSYVLSNGAVVHNCHRHGAPEWGKAMSKFPAKKRLGVSATLERKDGLDKLVYANIGGVGHVMPRNRLETRLAVRRVPYAVDRKRYYQAWNNKPNMAKLTNQLAYNDKRTKMIVDDVEGAARAGRKSLVLTCRLDQVDKICVALALRDVDVARFVGGMKEDQQVLALQADVVVATWPMAQEGLDCPPLDTLFLATPKSGGANLEQAVGRIQRFFPGKKEPLVIDYVDHKVPICQGMYRSRTKRYRLLGVRRG